MVRTRILQQGRSSAAIAPNPNDGRYIVQFCQAAGRPRVATSLVGFFSSDGAASWRRSAPLRIPMQWRGFMDPALAWDANGVAHLMAVALDADMEPSGMVAFRSTDRGFSWEGPRILHAGRGDIHHALAADLKPESPFCGSLYAVWDNDSHLCFARSTDSGETWCGAGRTPAGPVGAGDCWCPELVAAPNGAVFIGWAGLAANRIVFTRSGDGGESFTPAATVADGITRLGDALPHTEGWPHFPGAGFRVVTIPAGCCNDGGSLVFAWADYRQGVSRIYYRYSGDGGEHWEGSSSGEPLLRGPAVTAPGQHEFQPQFLRLPGGESCCAFYDYGPKGGEKPLIDVIAAVSADGGRSFSQRMLLTETPWDPESDVPLPRGSGHGGLAWLHVAGAAQTPAASVRYFRNSS